MTEIAPSSLVLRNRESSGVTMGPAFAGGDESDFHCLAVAIGPWELLTKASLAFAQRLPKGLPLRKPSHVAGEKSVRFCACLS